VANIRFTTDELNKRVLQVFQEVRPTIDRRITKESICIQVFGKFINDTYDRKVRDAITELTLQGHPICATSDVPGYFIASTYEEAEQCIMELRSRAQVFNEKIDGIKRGLVNAKQPIREAVQTTLWG
jgi:hypothetical protein